MVVVKGGIISGINRRHDRFQDIVTERSLLGDSRYPIPALFICRLAICEHWV